jgi:hypothetical protein
MSGMRRKVAILGVVTMAAAMPLAGHAAEKRARLTIEVKIEGTESVVGNGNDRTSGKFREGYTMITYLASDGDLQQYNTKDPDYANKMTGHAQNIQRKVNEMQGTAKRLTPAKKMTQAELQAYVQKKQAACAGDQSCLMKLAFEAQELMANLDTGGATTAGSEAEAYTGDEEPRYLNYFGAQNCGATAHVYVDRTTTGQLGDTTGPVPYTVVDKADYRSNATENLLYCSAHTLVVDSKDGSFYTDGVVLPSAKGTSVKTIRGKTEQSSGEAAMHGELYSWVSEQLRHAPRAGSKNARLKLTQGRGGAIHSGKYSGEASVTVSWKLEDVK